MDNIDCVMISLLTVTQYEVLYVFDKVLIKNYKSISQKFISSYY